MVEKRDVFSLPSTLIIGGHNYWSCDALPFIILSRQLRFNKKKCSTKAKADP
jgi:hypothetical protein